MYEHAALRKMIAAPLEKRNAELERLSVANQELREKGQALLDAWADFMKGGRNKYATAGAADALRKTIADTQANLKKEEILNV
jgi:hypothetical protein